MFSFATCYFYPRRWHVVQRVAGPVIDNTNRTVIDNIFNKTNIDTRLRPSRFLKKKISKIFEKFVLRKLIFVSHQACHRQHQTGLSLTTFSIVLSSTLNCVLLDFTIIFFLFFLEFFEKLVSRKTDFCKPSSHIVKILSNLCILTSFFTFLEFLYKCFVPEFFRIPTTFPILYTFCNNFLASSQASIVMNV
jgi:hypothetical protein